MVEERVAVAMVEGMVEEMAAVRVEAVREAAMAVGATVEAMAVEATAGRRRWR